MHKFKKRELEFLPGPGGLTVDFVQSLKVLDSVGHSRDIAFTTQTAFIRFNDGRAAEGHQNGHNADKEEDVAGPTAAAARRCHCFLGLRSVCA